MPTGDPICPVCKNYVQMCSCRAEKLQQVFMTPEDFVNVQPMIDSTILTPPRYTTVFKSLFDVPADAYVNTINCVGVMGAGIALEFKNRYPLMFEAYKLACLQHRIRPGDCYTYYADGIYILGLAVKDDWRHWSTLEWIESSIKSLKLTLLEHDIKSVNLPLLGGKNGRRGPYGKVSGFTPPPDRVELKSILQNELGPFADKFGIDITLCLPDEAPKKKEPDLTQFLEA